MCHLAKPVNYGQDSRVSCRGGKISDKIQGYVGPEATGYGKWMKMTNRSLMKRFVLVAGWAGFDKFSSKMDHQNCRYKNSLVLRAPG